uniref:SLX9 ribosome biosis factor n=1 Tax=Meleagris gallopavo TaxID=9103 RepID=A0A803XZ34_MELGA
LLVNISYQDWDFSSSDIFSGLTIDPDSLVKKLDLDSRSIVSSKTEIESVKLAKRKQKAEAKRKATPVVGDMQPLMEALPELSDLTAGIKGRKPSKREEEMAQFHDVIADPRYKAHPLLVISEHLSERLRQEEGKPL